MKTYRAAVAPLIGVAALLLSLVSIVLYERAAWASQNLPGNVDGNTGTVALLLAGIAILWNVIDKYVLQPRAAKASAAAQKNGTVCGAYTEEARDKMASAISQALAAALLDIQNNVKMRDAEGDGVIKAQQKGILDSHERLISRLDRLLGRLEK
jgi:hypothetical protein